LKIPHIIRGKCVIQFDTIGIDKKTDTQESEMNSIIVEVGSPIRCNRCSEVFAAPKEMTRGDFWKNAARINDDFCTCPHCDQTDVHWTYESDLS
jgi:hypothetical protein